MPEDNSRVSYDENGGKVTRIPEGTPKDELKRQQEQERQEDQSQGTAEVEPKNDGNVHAESDKGTENEEKQPTTPTVRDNETEITSRSRKKA